MWWLFDGDGGVDEVELFGSAGDCGVEPAIEIEIECVRLQCSHVDVDMTPLPPLCLVARQAVGIFDLQCIVVGIILYSLQFG